MTSIMKHCAWVNRHRAMLTESGFFDAPETKELTQRMSMLADELLFRIGDAVPEGDGAAKEAADLYAHAVQMEMEHPQNAQVKQYREEAQAAMLTELTNAGVTTI